MCIYNRHMYARMYAVARRMHFSVRVRAFLCMSARACARERRERRRNTPARPLDVIHHVGMYMCECMNGHMDVREDSMQVRVRVRTCARRERLVRAPTRRVTLRAYICVRMYECMYVYDVCMSACMCMSVGVYSMGVCVCA
jgi:hypothetical protein